jgi:transcriptional regulator with XRE-family HTH domain
MSRNRRPRTQIVGEQRAGEAAAQLGREVQATRKRRRLTQDALANRVGISRQRLGDIEAGRGGGAPLTVWFALGEALGRPFRSEFVRDRLEEPVDAGHLAIQELVLKLGRSAGYEGRFELPTRPADPARSSDAPLLDRRGRRLILVECWNTFGDLGAAARSSDRKLADAEALAVVLGGEGKPFKVGLCWVVRDTARNRGLVARYEHIFASRFPESSARWANAITNGGPIPDAPGLVWCDLRATRLFARRRTRETGLTRRR